MHSTIVRAQTVFGFFTTVAFVVAALIATSDFISPRTPTSNVILKEVQVVRGRPHYYSTKREQYASIRFSLNADLSSLFTWNTKQVFVWVSAAWPNGTAPALAEEDEVRNGGKGRELVNEAVIWDVIITNPSADHLQNIKASAMRKLVKGSKGKSVDPSRGILDLKNQKPKYQITAPSGELANTEDVVLKVHYNVQPWVGVLTWTPQMNLGWWKRMEGGVSKKFKFPALKVKKETK